MADAPDFWTWFKTQAAWIAAAGLPTPEDMLDEILVHLHAYCSGLYFEIGGQEGEAGMELVITAEGDVEHFAAVRALVASAPEMEGWTVVAFKPAMGFEFSIETRDVSVDPAKCWVLPLVANSDPTRFGVRIAVPGYKKRKDAETAWACVLLLQAGLGEERAAEQIQHVEACALPKDPAGQGFFPLPQIDRYLRDRARAHLH